jgi:hypothetical protein
VKHFHLIPVSFSGFQDQNLFRLSDVIGKTSMIAERKEVGAEFLEG